MKKDTLNKANDIVEEIQNVEYRIDAISELLNSKESLTITLGSNKYRLFYNDQEVIGEILTKDLIVQQARARELHDQFNKL